MINLHESMGPGRDQTRGPCICSQTRICCQTRYRLRYAAWCKTCVQRPLSKRPKIGFQDQIYLNAGRYVFSLSSLFCLFLVAVLHRFYCIYIVDIYYTSKFSNISYVSHLYVFIIVQYRTISTAMTRTGS